RIETFRGSNDFNVEIAGENLLPEDAQLEIRKPVADTTVDARAIGKMLARLGAVDDEGIGIVDGGFVAVARNVPHDDLVALANALTGQLDVTRCRAAPVDDRCLVAGRLRDG